MDQPASAPATASPQSPPSLPPSPPSDSENNSNSSHSSLSSTSLHQPPHQVSFPPSPSALPQQPIHLSQDNPLSSNPTALDSANPDVSQADIKEIPIDSQQDFSNPQSDPPSSSLHEPLISQEQEEHLSHTPTAVDTSDPQDLLPPAHLPDDLQSDPLPPDAHLAIINPDPDLDPVDDSTNPAVDLSHSPAGTGIPTEDQHNPQSVQQRSSSSTSARSTDEDPNRKTPVDFNSSELVQALKPFDHGQDKSPATRRTVLRNLPQMLRNFQSSRDTLYFTEGGLEAIEQFANDNPDLVINNDELISLLEMAKNTHAHRNLPPDHSGSIEWHQPSLDNLVWPVSAPGSQENLASATTNRIRSAESPPSSDDGQPSAYFGSNSPSPTDPFPHHLSRRLANLSDDEPSVHSDPDITLRPQDAAPGEPSKTASSRPAKRISAPVAGTRHERPMPPSRKKKSPSIDSPRTQVPLSRLPHPLPEIDTQLPSGSRLPRSPSLPPEGSLPFPSDPESPSTHSNFLEVLTAVKRGDMHHLGGDSNPEPSDGPEVSANELFRRLRPGSEVFTRTYESTDSMDYKPPNVDKMYEDYPMMQKAYSALHHKAKEMEQHLELQERIHEEELVKMSDKIEELQQEVTARTKGERDEKHVANQQRIQLDGTEAEIAKLQKELDSAKLNYSKLKLKWEEAADELDKVRTSLHEKEEDLRHANRAIQNHNSDMQKWNDERRLFQDQLKAMKADVEQLQVAKHMLEEQKHANMELQMTLDRVKYELEEQRALQSGVSSRPGSLPGSMSQSVGAELKKAMATGEYPELAEQPGEGTESDEAQIDRIVKRLNEGIGNERDDIYEEIQIKRIKRRQFRNRSGTIVAENSGSSGGLDLEEIDEELVELQDAATDTDDLIPTESREVQTEVIPEPPPLYRPKTEELQVQTEPLVVGLPRGEMEELVEGIDVNLLKEAVARIGRERAAGPTVPRGGFFSRLGLSNSILNAIAPLSLYSTGTGGTPEGRLISNAQLRLWCSVVMLLAAGCVIGQLVLPATGQRPAMMVVEFIRNSAGSGAVSAGEVQGGGIGGAVGSKVWVEFFELGSSGWDEPFLAHEIVSSSRFGGWAAGGGGIGGWADGGSVRSGVWKKVYEFGMRILWDGMAVAKRATPH